MTNIASGTRVIYRSVRKRRLTLMIASIIALQIIAILLLGMPAPFIDIQFTGPSIGHIDFTGPLIGSIEFVIKDLLPWPF